MNKEQMISALQTEVCVVTFTKKNNETRQMNCTLKTSLIPEEHLPKSEVKFPDSAVIRVYDLDKNNWRSFNFQTVTSFLREGK